MTTQAPDIEIYLLNCTREDIESWLTSRFEAFQTGKHHYPIYNYSIHHHGHDIPVMLVENAAEKRFTSLWFNSAETPWPTDQACAEEVFAALHCEVRCAPGGWQEGDEPDLWWRVNAQGEGLITWR